MQTTGICKKHRTSILEETLPALKCPWYLCYYVCYLLRLRILSLHYCWFFLLPFEPQWNRCFIVFKGVSKVIYDALIKLSKAQTCTHSQESKNVNWVWKPFSCQPSNYPTSCFLTKRNDKIVLNHTQLELSAATGITVCLFFAETVVESQLRNPSCRSKTVAES